MADRLVNRLLAAFSFAVSLSCALASAAVQTDPVALFATMQRAYDEGVAKGWPFASALRYESTVFDAGRSYALFNATDPHYGDVAAAAVKVATEVHYDALLNDDASVWYVREAAKWVADHDADPENAKKGAALYDKIVAGDTDATALAAQAEDDAKANAVAFRRDSDSLVQIVIADVRAYNLTRDLQYRSLLLLHASEPALPLTRLPAVEGAQLFAVVDDALHASSGFSETDRFEAKTLTERRRATPRSQNFGKTIASNNLRLLQTAPADEYFGRTRLSPLGAGNEIIRISKYLDAGWGTRMAQDALYLESSIEDWQRQYPHDPTLPKRLVAFYRLLLRIDDASTQPEAKKIHDLVLVQYAGTAQARELAEAK
jgi:hypothetical protein